MENMQQSVSEMPHSMATSSIQDPVSESPVEQSSQPQKSSLNRSFQPYIPLSKENPSGSQLAKSNGYPPVRVQSDIRKTNPRVAVKITHPETKEELKLDDVVKERRDFGPSSSTKTHLIGQLQAFPATYNHFMNYYPYMQLDPLSLQHPSSVAVSKTDLFPASAKISNQYLGMHGGAMSSNSVHLVSSVANGNNPTMASRYGSNKGKPTSKPANGVTKPAISVLPSVGNSDFRQKGFQGIQANVKMHQQDLKQSGSQPLSSLAEPYASHSLEKPNTSLHQNLKHPGRWSIGVDGTKRYPINYLLTFSSQFVELPKDFELTDDTAKALSFSSYALDDNVHNSTSSAIQLEQCRIAGENFSIHSTRGDDSNIGLLPLAMSQQGSRTKRRDADQPGRRLSTFPQSPMQLIHKAERKYEARRVIIDMEEAKQRRLKSILNKLTPQNFETLFEQVKEVNIDNTVTLSGLISQIFYKALMEPTFCEMYASFCWHLASVLPNFVEGHQTITFKRLLLNKCQEEFVRGEREEAEASRIEENGGTKHSKEKGEETRTRTRRRMLGNIRLIGELYKKRMLTEKVLRECINKLLGDQHNPDEEDIEALCKLMSTVGEIVDHPKAKDQIDSYFKKMKSLSKDGELSPRIRFMLKDVIDLRNNKWRQRRKVEKPKKIEDIHSDAAQERRALVNQLISGSNFTSSNRRAPGFVDSGSSAFLSPRHSRQNHHGNGSQDARLQDKRHDRGTGSVSFPSKDDGKSTIMGGNQNGFPRKMRTRSQ